MGKDCPWQPYKDKDMNDIVVRNEASSVAMVQSPARLLAIASEVATEIAKVIEKQKLYSIISGKKYVKVDAYIALGNVRGIYPQEVSTVEHEDGTFESHVELVDSQSGRIVGKGSAIVGSDEPTWRSRPRFARRSMAITRATGKAFRIRDAWILALAGYEGTPAEEMEHVRSDAAETATSGTSTSTATVSEPTSDIYTAREDQEKKLTVFLTDKKVPKEKQLVIKARMMNRHGSELKNIMAEVMA